MRSIAQSLARDLRALARLLTTLFPFLRRRGRARALVAVALHGRTIAPLARGGQSA